MVKVEDPDTPTAAAPKPSAPSKRHVQCCHFEETRLPQTNRFHDLTGRRESDQTSLAAPALCDFMKTEHHFTFFDVSFTCDVVEVVETVEVQAAGLLVSRVRTLPPHTGRPEGVRHPHSTVGSGTRLKQRVSK